MHGYGCPDCGSTTFAASDGTRVEGTGPAAPPSAPLARRVTPNALDHQDAAFLSMTWTCGTGHPIRPESPLWYALEALSAAPFGYGPVALPPNE
jgi:hypothetical protein